MTQKYPINELKGEARKKQIESATLTGIANGTRNVDSYKEVFLEDDSIEDKSLESFLDFMVKNISSGVRYNIVKSALVFKPLPPYGEEGVSNAVDREIEF